jgi:putative transposase
MASKRHKRYKSQEILQRLRQAEVLIGQGRTVAEACREIGVTEVTHFRSVRCSTSGRSA